MFASELNISSGTAWQSWSKSKIRCTQPAPGRQAGLFIATEGPDLTTKRNRNFVLLVLSLFPEFRWGSQTSAEIEASEKQGIRVSGDNVSCHRNLLSRQFSTAPSPSRPFFPRRESPAVAGIRHALIRSTERLSPTLLGIG